MPQLEELDALSTQGMVQQAGTGESWGALCCFLLWLPARSQARLFHSVFLFHLKSNLLSVLPLGLNGCLVMPLLYFISFWTQI